MGALHVEQTAVNYPVLANSGRGVDGGREGAVAREVVRGFGKHTAGNWLFRVVFLLAAGRYLKGDCQSRALSFFNKSGDLGWTMPTVYSSLLTTACVVAWL